MSYSYSYNFDYAFLADEMDDWDDWNDGEDNLTRLPKRYIRDQENPIESMEDHSFRRRYRFHKATVVEILLPLVYGDEEPITQRGLPLPPLLKLLTALRLLASSSFQVICGDLFKIHQTTVHRLVKDVSERLCRKIAQFIKLPQEQAEIRKTHRDFYRKGSFPGIIGLIDGTHIPIKSPGGRTAEVFRNRKGYFSINVQLVAGPNDEIYDIVCRWPGSAHDSRIFENSSIKLLLQQNHATLGHLLGDAGYSLKPYLLTPLPNPATQPEIRYNRAHKTTRSSVERTFGKLKRRFACLYYESQYKLSNTLRIIPACCILFNIGLRVGDIWTEEDEAGENPRGAHDEDIDTDTTQPSTPSSESARNIRTAFILRHFAT